MTAADIKIPASEKTLTSGKLFYNWFAANIGIMGVVYGAIIVGYHLSFVQLILAALVGALTFAIPGWVAVVGQREGVTTFKLSRAAFGVFGNRIPNVMAWFNMIGWLAINVITGTLLLTTMFQTLAIKKSPLIVLISLIIFASFVILSGTLKEATLATVQTLISWVFGLLTLVILALFFMHSDWQKVFAMPAGSWLAGFLPAVAFIAAGSSISWSMAAADWGAYVRPETKPAATFWQTTLGAGIPLFILMVGGIFLSTVSPHLATANDPYQAMYGSLPTWLGPIYFLVAAGGLVPQCLVSFRSARINLATIGIQLTQKRSLIGHSLVILTIAVYILFISGNFLTNFELFLNFLGICLASWVAIFLTDAVLNRRDGYDLNLLKPTSPVHYNWAGIAAWVIATIFGFLFTSNSVYRGPFAHGIFAHNSSLAVFVSGLAAIVVLLVASLFQKKERN